MRILLLMTTLLLSACSSGDTSEEAPSNEAAPSEATDGNGQGAASADAARPLAWTGRFAASQDLCTGGVWAFERNQVRTDGETYCSINNVVEDAGLVRLTLACTAEGMDTQEQWTLTPTPEGGMTVVRELLGRETARVGLIRCG